MKLSRSKKRLLYQVIVLFRPSYWIRVAETDHEWDNILWDALESEPIKFVGKYDALVGDLPVWIANHPYASGSIKSGLHKVDGIEGDRHCSRATSLLLERKLKHGRITAVLFNPGVTHLWLENGDILS